jgi:hypothetical protein
MSGSEPNSSNLGDLVVRLVFLLMALGSAAAQSTGAFTLTGPLTALRSQHTVTLLFDTRVLLAGEYGFAGEGLASFAVQDPSSAAFGLTGYMLTAGRMHSATRLTIWHSDDGRVVSAVGLMAAQ